MKKYIDPLIVKLLWFLAPVLQWFDHTFTLGSTVKKVDGDDYYSYRDLINKGCVFITDTAGQASNIVNPSKGKHGAIYYGRGLASHIKNILQTLQYGIDSEPESIQKEYNKKKFDRLHRILNDYKLNDDVCYVLESTGRGVIATNLVKFMTTKDVFKAFTPNFYSSEDDKKRIMGLAADAAVEELGLPYDYGFSNGDDSIYCFELPADAYIKTTGVILDQKEFLGHKFYLADTFTADHKNWTKIIDLPISK